MLLPLKRVRCLSVSVFLLLLVIAGCMSGAGGGGDQGGGSGSDTSNSPGGDTGGDTGGGTGGGTGGDTGGGTGTGTGGDTGTGGTGGTGGGTGGTGDTGTVYGTFATLYTATDVSTEVVSCVNPASGIKSFSSAVLRVIGQNGNFVDAVLTLTPNQDFVAEFDQIFVNLSGEFQADGSFLGTISNIIYSLNGNVLVQAIGSITINVFGASISVEFTADMQNPDCGLAGGFFMTESTDTGTGGGTGGDTGGGTGGTGGTGGGGTGTGSATTGTDGSVVQATGDFGILTFDSTDHPEDSGSYQLTSALLLTYVGQEVFAWYNAEQTTVNVYFGFGDTQTAQGFMTFNSANGRNYICDCFPSIDLVNYEASFNNLILSDSNIPPGTISINGVLAFPTAN